MEGLTEKPLTGHLKPDGEALDISEYEGYGGYEGLRKALRMGHSEIQKEVKEANLRGRGGAGFNTGLKWSFVPMGKDAPRPKYLVANADEMEPGTFKDRFLLERNPHLIIEGMIIASFAIEAETAFVFLRWEYTLAAKRMRRAIAEAYERGYLGRNMLGSGFNLDLRVHVSAGRYICGEETALLNALEGRRAVPRSKPPFPQTSGLWGRPTVVNNVETLSNVPHIITGGAEWYRKLSRSGDGGTKLFGVSGRVKRPGLWELPMGTTAREILEEHAGGMADGFSFRCLIPGGASTEFICEEGLDVKMDFDSVQKAGSRLGTGTMIVLDHTVCPIAALHNLERFFAEESCGWCTPCREGLPWVARLLGAIEDGEGEPGDIETLREHTRSLWVGKTYCALAPGAMEPLKSGLAIFREDFERHIREKGCPSKRERG
ncbi:MAG: NADH-quinone oxidoreductase subunit NuoF [Deltaproteobacteria bacterium]|nr:NADH-quinone oxidoreductase subunit NuoF [Deltaproteobacteria bacterium]MCL4873773.1 NADH-quinone oxidoreductase subunit NuoF [bacterium]